MNMKSAQRQEAEKKKATSLAGDILLPNVCGDLPLAGARMECTDEQ